MTAVLVVTLTILVGAWHFVRRGKLRADEQAWRPSVLTKASIEYAEQRFYAERPFRLVAKVDRAYRTPGGLVLTELKQRRRRRAYPSDVIQLSAQKLAIERSIEQRVSRGAYVVVEDPATSRRTSIAVRLAGEAEVVALAEHYEQVMSGAVIPEKANRLSLCRSCVHLKRCKPEVMQGTAANARRARPAAS